MKMMPYTFIGVLGTSPAVVTETLWAFARQKHPPLFPRSIHILTTNTGEAIFRASVLGEERTHPQTGQVLPCQDVWTPFCKEVLGGQSPELKFYVAENKGGKDADIRTADEDQRFGLHCYHVVRHILDQADASPVIGSIAGGRKTMSAHLMNAFSLFARPQDMLVHVLVNPPELEMNRSFFYPDPARHGFSQIDLVHLQFPRLGTRFSMAHLSTEALLQHIPMVEPETTSLHFEVQARKMHLQLSNAATENLGSVLLPANIYATLFVFIKLNTIHTPYNFEELNKLRQKAYEQVRSSRGFAPWEDSTDVTKAISRLKKVLATMPLLAKTLEIETSKTFQETKYFFTNMLPQMEGL
jgi:CRISPR-associated protein (TIGR02584 family)